MRKKDFKVPDVDGAQRHYDKATQLLEAGMDLLPS